MREIILPPHLYDRIKASAGEHGGIGRSMLFDGPEGDKGTPLCAHGHAWGTCTRFQRADRRELNWAGAEPELIKYLRTSDNDGPLLDIEIGQRISFAEWCIRLNVKRGVEVTVPEPELVSVA